MTILRDFFIHLSKNSFFNEAAQKYGSKFGAERVIAGTTIFEVMENIKKLNELGISCTVAVLGEYVTERTDAIFAKDQILEVIEAIHVNDANAHISIKPSQLGLDIDIDFCYDNIVEIVRLAAQYDIHVNFDLEDYERLRPSLTILDKLAVYYDNVGTVIQAYFFHSKANVEKYKNFRLRIVKGAYKESAAVSFQTKKDIDFNFIELIEYHLLHGKFTSIATHDHRIIQYVKQFVHDHQIPRDQFEFQMLYGFRTDLLNELVKDGYRCCVYVPFGDDWYAYFMRRLAERPQNIQLVTKQVFTKKTNAIIGLTAAAFLLGRWTKRK